MDGACDRFPSGIVRSACLSAERGIRGGIDALENETRREAIRQLGGVPVETVGVIGIIALFVFVLRK